MDLEDFHPLQYQQVVGAGTRNQQAAGTELTIGPEISTRARDGTVLSTRARGEASFRRYTSVSELTDAAQFILLSPAAWAGAVCFHGTELPGTVLDYSRTLAAQHGLLLPPGPAPDPPVEYHLSPPTLLGPPSYRILIGNG